MLAHSDLRVGFDDHRRFMSVRQSRRRSVLLELDNERTTTSADDVWLDVVYPVNGRAG